MTVAVYRYELELFDRPVVAMPVDARVLSVAPSRRSPRRIEVWALVSPDAELEQHGFVLVGTGHPMDDAELGRFIGTFSLYDGTFIGHLFEAA